MSAMSWIRRMLPVVVLSLALGTVAQEVRLGESIDITIVNIEVHVTDKKGNLVTGLTAADFEIRENRKAQPITNFSEFRSAATPGTMSVEATPDLRKPEQRQPRSIVVFIEPLNLVTFRADEFYNSLRTMLKQAVQPGDQVAIVTFRYSMNIRQPFTGDLGAIDATLAELQKEAPSLGSTRRDESQEILTEIIEAEKEYERELLKPKGYGSRGQAPVTPAIAASEVSLPTLSAARHELFLIRQKTAALESLMQSMSGVAGRKIVLMATHRFGLHAGAEYFGGVVPTQARQELDTTGYRQSLIRTANAYGVTVYPLHPEGLLDGVMDEPGRADAILHNERGALLQIADETGGVFAWGTVNIAKLLPRIGDDLDTYYSLGYRATTTGKDDSRKIVVTAKNPNYVVRARREFVEKSETTQMKERVRANLFQRVEGSTAQIPFDVAVGQFRKAGRNKWTVPLKIRIPIGSLTVLPRGAEEAGSFSVFFATGGVLGVMSEVEQRTQEFIIPRGDLTRAKQSYFTYDLELSVDKLVQTMSIAVMDEVGKEFGIKRFALPKTARE